MPNYAEIVSTIALVASFGSLSVSAYVAARDRQRLVIQASVQKGLESPLRIGIAFINAGRRPIILRALGGTTENGRWSSVLLASAQGGIRVGEHERHEEVVNKEDLVAFLPDGEDLIYETLWVEDSIGKRHEIPNSKELVRRMWEKPIAA